MSKLVAIMLALALFPSVGGHTRATQAVQRTGELAVGEQGSETPGTERGCSALFHLCSCHASPSSTPTGAGSCAVERIADSAGRSVVPDSDIAQTRHADPPPLPPPIA